MKPVFENEKNLLENKLKIKLPDNIWRSGCNLYLNADKKTKILSFKVVNRTDIVVIQNNINSILLKHINKSYEQEILENNDRLNVLESESISKTIDFIKSNPGFELRPSISGGKDSDVMWHILNKVFNQLNINNYTIDFMNSTNESGQTYLHIKNHFPSDKLKINNPKQGLYDWLKNKKDYYIPTAVSRICCSTYKEGEIKKVLDKNQNYIIFLGCRKSESSNRAQYDWDLNERMNELYKKTGKNKYKLYIPSNWKRFLPILNWTDEDVWFYILREGIKYNNLYNMGFNRVGCLLCCYMSDYSELLVKEYYPFLSKRWDNLLEIHYDKKDVARRLKYSKDEFINQGKWKSGSGKEQALITKKATPKRILELASLKGCSKEIAAKYFNKICSCNKKLNAEEIGMFLKFFGRYENSVSIKSIPTQMTFFEDNTIVEDDRKFLCKECFCKEMGITKEQYTEQLIFFRQTGCNLF